jgi:hypothetical protein
LSNLDLENDNLFFCKKCAGNGFPNEAIRFVQVGETEELVTFDFKVWKLINKPKRFAYNYFEGGRHHHKRKQNIEEVAI